MPNVKVLTIVLGIITHVMFFWGGVIFERTASRQALDEIMEISQEACDMRIKTLKFTCKGLK